VYYFFIAIDVTVVVRLQRVRSCANRCLETDAARSGEEQRLLLLQSTL